MKKHIKPILLLLIAANLLAIGTNFFNASNLGGDPIFVFNSAMSRMLKIEFGYFFLIHNALYFILLLIFDKKKVGLLTFVIVFLIGPLINLYQPLFSTPELLIVKLSFSLVGALIIGIAVGIFISTTYGLPPFEGVMLYLCTKFNFSIKKMRYILDACYLLIGVIISLLVHNDIGFGILIAWVTLGPVIELTHKIVKKTLLPEKSDITKTS